MASAADRLHVFYAGMLDDPEAPASVQRRVYGYACGAGDRKLLTRLASHPALLDELDDAFAESSDAYIVRAWMSRPGRPAEAIAARAAGETRITVLSCIAQVEGLTDETFAQLAMADHHKVAEALLANPSTPDGPLAAAAASYTRDISSRCDAGMASYKLARLLEPLKVPVASCPGAGPAMIAVTGQPALLALAATSPFLTPDDAALACQKALDFIAPEPTSSWRATDVIFARAAVMIAALRGPGRDERVETKARRLLTQLNAELTNKSSTALRSLIGDLASAIKGRGISVRERARLEQARRFCELAQHQRDELVADVVAQGPPAATRLLMSSPQTTPAQAFALAVSSKDDFSAVATSLQSRRSDPETYGAMLAARPGLIERHLAQCTDPSAALLACIRTAGADGRKMHRAVLESPLLNLSMLLEAPAGVLAQDLPAQTRRLVSELVSDRLGDDETAWQTFEGLIGQFDGPVKMLLEVCDSMADDAAERLAS